MVWGFSEAQAAVDTAASAGSQVAGVNNSLILMLGTVAIFYFVLIRPQNKRMKDQQQMIARIQVGDEVVTVGGVMGQVTHLNDQYMVLKVSEGLNLKFLRQALTQVLPQGTLKQLEQS